jgi:adenylate cyclase
MPLPGIRGSHFRIGFRTSIVIVFLAVVLAVGLTLVFLSFERVSQITRTAASGFIEKVAQLGAERIDEQFRNVRDNLEILADLPSIQSATIRDNPRLNSLLAAMLRNNDQLFNLYIGYEDGSFLEMDVVDRAGKAFRTSLKADEDVVYRLALIARGEDASPKTTYLLQNLIRIAETPGPAVRPPPKAMVPRRRPKRRDPVDGSVRLS